MLANNMYMYHLTLQKPQGITHAIYGSFSGAKAQEIVAVKGTRVLELLRVDENFQLRTICSLDIFGIIRSICPFRLTGSSTDYVIVGSDSGKIAIIEYDATINSFKKVHLETFGKSGCRRIVPGQYVAADPKGRACMIAAVEKQKFVYVLNRDATARLTISSPLECHRSRTFVLHIVGVDVGYENPVFAALEIEYEEDDDEGTNAGGQAEEPDTMLTFYELDLGLNHVVRKWSDPVGFHANLMFAVPGGNDGPGGVLICAENLILYKNQGCDNKLALLPRRKGLKDEHPLIIVSGTLVKKKGSQPHSKSADNFFFLLQNELGDLYEVTLEVFDGEVRDISISYFDTLPVSAAICVMKIGFLFAASEFGNHSFYQFQTSQNIKEVEQTVEVLGSDTNTKLIRFEPTSLRRLIVADKLESASPILDLQIQDLCHEDSKQIYAFCGRTTPTLRVLRHGIQVSEVAASTLPSVANGVWTVRRNSSETVDAYIVVSFPQATIVLSIDESSVQEVNDTGFVNTVSTLSVSLLGDDAMLQIHPEGIRHIRSNGRKHDWRPPGKSIISKAAVNQRQVVIALNNGVLFYFELDDASQLLEVDKKELGQDITSLEIAPLAQGRSRSRFLTVGTVDSTVRILSLDPDNCLSVLAVQKLPDLAASLCMCYLDDGQSGDGYEGQQTLYLNIGLNNGVVLRTVMDPVNGSLSDTRTRYLGSRAAKLFRVSLRGSSSIIALSTRPWLCYAYQKQFSMTPLSYQYLEFASSFASEQTPDGIVAISQNNLLIFTIEKLGETFHQTTVPLKYIPRKTLVHPETNLLIVLQSDHRAFTANARARYERGQTETQSQVKMEIEDDDMDVDGENGAPPVIPQTNGHKQANHQATETVEDEEEEEEEEESNVLPVPAPHGCWASCIQLIDPTQITNNGKTHISDQIELDDNEAAVSMCFCSFSQRGGESFLCVGTALDLQLMPRSCSSGRIRVYRFVEGGRKFVLEHSTPTDDVPTALHEFQGRLLAGLGTVLRIYDVGKRKLLRKSENKNFLNSITRIHVEGNRIIVGDVSESFVYCRYRRDTNSIHIFADDTVPHWLTASCQLDFDTMCGGDKFGNFYIATLPHTVNESVEDDPTGSRINWFSHGLLNGAPNKLETCANFFTGDIITSMKKTVLVAGGYEVILCSTIGGAIVAFLPISSRSEVEFLSALEMHLRQEKPPLCGRDHLAYRSQYFPVKCVIDGDLCEQFAMLPASKQREISEELDNRTPGEIAKKLEDMRNRIL